MRYSVFLFAAPLLLTALVSGCKEEAKTVEWYKQNPSELKTVYEKCKASGDDTDNCRNAKQAHYDIQQKNAPVMQFN